jgi:MOSC domain-containing protein YiiM
LGVLRRIRREFNGRLGLNSFVIKPGRVTVGDTVELIPPT